MSVNAISEFSVVIPVYRDDAELQSLLRTLTSFPIAEIIIVDSEHRPPPAHIIAQFPKLNIQWCNARRGRGPQIAAGIKAAAQPIVWVLHADNRPTPDCLADISVGFIDPKTALVCFPLAFRTQKLALSLFAFMSRFDSAVTTFGDQGYAFRRADYDKLDIDLSDFPLLEDIVLRKALRGLGKVRKIQNPLLTSARRFDRLGVWRTQIRNIGILLSYWRGASPTTLHTRYYQPTPQTTPMSRLSSLAHRVSMRVRAAVQKTASD